MDEDDQLLYVCGLDSFRTPKPDDSFIEVLICLIHNRKPLWDHRLPMSKRGKNEKDRLWAQIAKEMGGAFTIESLQKKWRNLRDQFLKTKTQLSSDSAIHSKKKVWKHYESLKFLQETVQARPTWSKLKTVSVHSVPNTESDDSVASFLSDVPMPVPKQERLEDPLATFPDRSIALPAPAQELLPSMVLASSLLQKLPIRVRMKAERTFINELYGLVEEHAEN